MYLRRRDGEKWQGPAFGRRFGKNEEDRGMMETCYYVVESIEGDYANLRRTDIAIDDLKLVARALLPPEIREGSTLKYEMMQYELMEP